ncbi:MAG: carbohydrate kinase family protein [Armatimonadetes bacterium]|nr:carbohydrate kinase family protein [Akkermansiaceae bacterium]
MLRHGILAAGNFIVDRVKLIDQYPAQDTLASILSETPSNGGGPYNLLTDLAHMRVNYPLHAVGLIGDDPDGQWILDHCRENSINTDLLVATPDFSTSYTDVMTVRSTGRRTFFHQRGANAHFDGSSIDFSKTTARILHLGYLLLLDHLDTFAADGQTQAAHFLANASSAGLITSLDLVSAEHTQFREIVLSSLPHTDLLFLNEIEAGKILGQQVDPKSPQEIAAAAKTILSHGVRRTVTLHTEYHAVSATASDETHHQPSLPVPAEKIKGANGAGDAFAAGFLHAIHEDLTIPQALLIAVKTAAQCLNHPTPSGGVRPLVE